MTIIIIGYYGSNLGDAMMLKGLVQSLEEKGYVIRVVSYGRPEYDDFFEYVGVTKERFLSLASLGFFQKISQFISFVRPADVVLWGGGTCFMDEESGEGGIKMMILARLLGKNVGYVSIGIGNIRKFWTRISLWLALKISMHFSIRDTRSYSLLKRIFSDDVNIRSSRSADLFYLNSANIILNDMNAENYLCLSLRDLGAYAHKDELRHIYDNCLYAVSSYCKLNGLAGVKVIACDSDIDRPIALELLEKLISLGMSCEFIMPSIQNNLNCILNSTVVFTARLHVVMIALVAGKPVFPINYSPKITELLASYRIRNHGIEISEMYDEIELNFLVAKNSGYASLQKEVIENDLACFIQKCNLQSGSIK